MESLSGELSGSHGVDSCWCHIDQQLAPMNTVYTVPRLRIKTLHYDTCAVEYSDEKKHSKKGGNRVRKVIRMIFLWSKMLAINLFFHLGVLLQQIVKAKENYFSW